MTAELGSLQQKVIDIMALTGDSADHVPGCPGIGSVKAAKLINRWGSLDALYVSVITGFTNEVLTPRLQQLLLENYKTVFISRELVRLDKHDDGMLPSIVRQNL